MPHYRTPSIHLLAVHAVANPPYTCSIHVRHTQRRGSSSVLIWHAVGRHDRSNGAASRPCILLLATAYYMRVHSDESSTGLAAVVGKHNRERRTDETENKSDGNKLANNIRIRRPARQSDPRDSA